MFALATFLTFDLIFSFLNFDFTISTFWYSIKYLANINCEVLLLVQGPNYCNSQYI